jgi:hypothetical protein
MSISAAFRLNEAVAAPPEVWFDEYDHRRPITSLVATMGRVLGHPRRFFGGLDPEGSYLTSTAFAIGGYVVYSILAGFAYTAGIAVVEQHPYLWASALGAVVWNLAGVPVLLVVFPVFAAATHLCVRLFAGERNAGFRATYRVMAYASAPDLVGWIPGVGIVIDLVWAVVLGTIGLRVMHQTTTRRALLVVVLSLFLAIVLFFALVGLFALLIGGVGQLLWRRA